MTIFITKPGGGGSADTTANTQNLVPYVGAGSDLNLGAKHLTVTGLTSTALQVGTLNGVLSGTTGAVSSIGTATSAEFLRGDLTWSAPAGGGDVTTAISGATNNTMVVWSGVSGTSVGTTNVIGLVTISTPGVVASMTTGQITVVSPLSKDNVTQTLGNSLAISLDTSNFFHSATTGAVSATTPISVTASRQALGGAMVISINTANMVPYVGAQSDLNLATKHLIATGVTATNIYITGGIVAPGISTLHSKSIVIDVPSETADYPIWKVPYAITIRRVAVLCTGAAAATIVGFLDECDANGAGASAVSGDTTATSGTDRVTTVFDNSSIDANDYIRWHTASTSGVLASACITMDYIIN